MIWTKGKTKNTILPIISLSDRRLYGVTDGYEHCTVLAQYSFFAGRPWVFGWTGRKPSCQGSTRHPPRPSQGFHIDISVDMGHSISRHFDLSTVCWCPRGNQQSSLYNRHFGRLRGCVTARSGFSFCKSCCLPLLCPLDLSLMCI